MISSMLWMLYECRSDIVTKEDTDLVGSRV